MVLYAYVIQAVKIRLKAVSNEGHYTVEAESVLRQYFP
jgi:hypothetical protein